jgi:hypothetical protein
MTVIDRLRAALPGTDDPSPGEEGSAELRSGAARGALVGMATGLASFLVVAVPVVLAWLLDPLSTGPAWPAVGTGAALWLLVSGAQLTSGDVVLSLVPLLGLAILVLLARVGAREAMVDVSTDGEYWQGLLPRPLAAAVGGWWAGYAVTVATGVAVATAGPFRVGVLSLVVPLVLLPLLALGLALRPVALVDPDVLGPRLSLGRVPDTVRRAVRPGLSGAVVLLGAGLLLVLVVVAASWPRVAAISAEVGATGFGAVLLVVSQLLSLGNLATWAVGFMAGPGFRVVEGGSVTWSGSDGGLLPMVPVLAALPQPGPFPWVASLSVLVVVAVGAFVARRALGEIARLSRLRNKVMVSALACLTTALVLGVLDVVAGGSVGHFRLSAVGVPAVPLVVAVFLGLFAGALLVVVRDAWKLRR